MDKPLCCDDSVLRRSTITVRPTCSVSPCQLNGHGLQCQNAENGREENSRKIIKSNMSSLMDTLPEILERRRSPTLVRSKTIDPSILSHVTTDSESKIKGKKQQSYHFLRTNTQYHKLFKDVCENELLKQSYTCALQKDILYQGRLFVSDNWICFHSKVFGKDIKIVIPVPSVSVIKKTKTALLVPNALIIATAHERYVLVSFLSRDTTYKVLMSVCPHLHDKCLENSPLLSSADGSYTGSPSTLLMNFSADLSDLEGPTDQRSHEMGYSSSSESPEYDKKPEHKCNVYESKTQRPSCLNVLLLVYLFLICILISSSCYLAVKIISLENRLNSIDAMAEFTHIEDEYNSVYSEDTSIIYSAVTINLLKLEKIQRGLQRLLDQTH